MPVVVLDRLPLPSLQAYTSVSVLLLSCSLYYSFQVTSQPGWKLNATEDVDIANLNEENITFAEEDEFLPNNVLNHAVVKRLYSIMYFMIQEPLCIWTLINMAYCCLILVGRFIQKLVFGELRVVEQQHIKDKFWNFVFYKFIFIFGVMNVQFMDEVVLWCSWFSVLGFLHLLAQLCKDRFEYLSFSPTTPKWTHISLFTLLLGILVASASLFAVCVVVGFHAGINTSSFMAAECTLVTLRTLYVICRYVIHLWDLTYEGVWERRGTYTYYSELVFELTGLTVDFFHHLHMLLWGNIFLSMASLVICMQLRYLFYEIQRKLKRHKNYLQVAKHMEVNYPLATPEEIEANSDDCAICWDHMDSARKLPCGHMFHTSCLRSWLEQDTTCPTCRMTLTDRERGNLSAAVVHRNTLLGVLGHDGTQPRTPNQTTNHFFHFDGSRYVSWLPSFSVEVSHTSYLGEVQPPPVQTSQLDSMAYQVLQMFPAMPMSIVLDDLRITRSVELTVENILEGRLVPPASVMFQSSRGGISEPSSSSHFQNFDNPSSSTSFERNAIEETEEVVDCVPHNNQAVISDGESDHDRDADLSVRTGGDGCRFSKSSQEREHMLVLRKEDLLKRARRRYLSRNKSNVGDERHARYESSSSSSSSS